MGQEETVSSNRLQKHQTEQIKIQEVPWLWGFPEPEAILPLVAVTLQESQRGDRD